jgi:hypothetical protein
LPPAITALARAPFVVDFDIPHQLRISVERETHMDVMMREYAVTTQAEPAIIVGNREIRIKAVLPECGAA